jgi:hypothetical protein
LHALHSRISVGSNDASISTRRWRRALLANGGDVGPLLLLPLIDERRVAAIHHVVFQPLQQQQQQQH